MLLAILPRTRQAIPRMDSLLGGLAALREERTLPQWLPLLLGLLLGPLTAAFIVDDQWLVVVPLVLFIPTGILFIRYPFVAVQLWILIFPFFRRDPSLAGSVAYWMLHRFAIPAALCVAVLADWAGLRKQRPLRLGPAEMSMVLFLLAGISNVLVLNETGPRSLILLYDNVAVPFCMYLLIRLLSPGERDLKRLAMVGIAVVLAQMGVALLSWYAPHTLPEAWLTRQGIRTAGAIGSPDVYSITLVFLSLLLVQTAVRSRPGVLRSVMVLTVALAFFGVFFSFSRASWLGAAVVLAGLIFLYPRLAFGFAIGAPLIVLALDYGVLENEMAWAGERLTTERTAENRIIVYAASLEMVQAKPLFGWGLGNHDLYVDRFKERVGDVPLQRGYKITSHNAYLTITAELGLVGFLLYAFPALWWLALSLKVRRRLPKSGFQGRSWLWMLWLALLDQFIVGNFNDLFSSGSFATILSWMALGLVANVVAPHLEDGQRNEPGRSASWIAKPVAQ